MLRPARRQSINVTVSLGTTLYLNGGGVLAERIEGSGGSWQWNHYLVASGGMVGVHITRSDTTVATRYFHKDHLGSITTLTNEVGGVVERLSYDAWDRRRFVNGTDDPAGSITSQTTRGFTEHEMLADVGLIHMNGRVYDPKTENLFNLQATHRRHSASPQWRFHRCNASATALALMLLGRPKRFDSHSTRTV